MKKITKETLTLEKIERSLAEQLDNAQNLFSCDWNLSCSKNA